MVKKKNRLKKVFIALGSNLGDREQNLKSALISIEQHLGKILSSSNIYLTEPWGHHDQPDFYNQVIRIETIHTPAYVLKKLLAIEEEMGRKRTFKNASRIIDLDILFYEDLCIESTNITIPHPLLTDRRFVLEPLNEIAPDLIHPLIQKPVSLLLKECKDPLKAEKIKMSALTK